MSYTPAIKERGGETQREKEEDNKKKMRWEEKKVRGRKKSEWERRNTLDVRRETERKR